MKLNPEFRARQGISIRAVTDDEKTAGYICALEGQIPYNSDSAELRDRSLNSGRPFIETLAPDCFKRSLSEDKDIMGFAGHTEDPLSAFARIGENLTITTDERGMSWKALVPDTQAGRDLRSLVERKIIKGTSFEFNVRGEGQKWEKRGDQDVRIITDARLYTVNPVAFPAYPESELTVSLRSRGANRRDSYFGTNASYDPTAGPDVVYAIESLGAEVCELCDALEYLRENPAGAHVAYATGEATDAAEAITALTDWLKTNGAAVPADLADRAKNKTAEARALVAPKDSTQEQKKADDADREMRRFLAFTVAPLATAENHE